MTVKTDSEAREEAQKRMVVAEGCDGAGPAESRALRCQKIRPVLVSSTVYLEHMCVLNR